MTEFFTWLLNFLREFRLFTIVLPWERAVRVRLGSHVAVWGPGWHLRIPFVDHVTPLNTRLRVSDTMQTLSTSDGKVLTLGMSVGFRIHDPLAAALTLQNPENACSAIAASVAAAYVSQATAATCSVPALEAHVQAQLQAGTPYAYEFVRVRDFAFARAYRLLNENDYRSAALHIEERKL